MKFLEDVTQILELILMIRAIAASQKTIITAIIAVAIYGSVKLVKAKRKKERKTK